MRHTELRYLISTALLVMFSTVVSHGQSIRFKPQRLAVDANEGIDIADINRDGKPDIVAGRNWYPAPNFTPHPLRSIEDWNGYVQSNGDFCLDVDHDGWIDVVAGSFLPTEVKWFKNPGKEGLTLGSIWKENVLVDTKLSQNEASFLRDFDGDGMPEWISNSWNQNNPVVIWKLNRQEIPVPDKSKSDSEKPPVSPNVQISATSYAIGQKGNTHGMGFGDLNHDGLEDILIGTGWYERPAGDPLTQTWKFHGDWEGLHASCPMIVRDINGDGRNDIVWGKGHDYGLYWWESVDTKSVDGKLQFKQHLIDDRFSQPHTIHFADLDGDGTEELITGKRFRGHNGNDPGGADAPCMYYYQWDAESEKFQRTVIDEGHIGTGLQIRTADLNGDGRTDIAVAGKDGTWILFNQPVLSNPTSPNQ